MSNVFLVLYEFRIEGLIKATHSEIAINNMSIGYGETGVEILVPQNLHGVDGYRLIRSIPLGRSRKSIREIREIVLNLEQEFTADTYDLFFKNCRHFSRELIDKLQPSHSEEGRMILGNLITFSENIGNYVNLIIANLVRQFPINPATVATFVLGLTRLFSVDQILHFDYDAKIQFCAYLLVSIFGWTTVCIARYFLENQNQDEEDELVAAIQDMEL